MTPQDALTFGVWATLGAGVGVVATVCWAVLVVWAIYTLSRMVAWLSS